MIRNKACHVSQGYSQMKGVDYDETFSLVACLESTRILTNGREDCFLEWAP